MRQRPSLLSMNAIRFVSMTLGMTSAGITHAHIFSAVDSSGAIVLTNTPGKVGLAVIVASGSTGGETGEDHHLQQPRVARMSID